MARRSRNENSSREDSVRNVSRSRFGIEWYEAAAQKGYDAAQANLGLMYYKGEGVPQDYGKACELWSKAAEQGNAEAQWGLGYLYQEGLGVTQDCEKAFKWTQQAAEGGSRVGMSNLAEMYEKGHGVEQDYGRAIELYTDAAYHDVAESQKNLGLMYLNGRGTAQDHFEAYVWCKLGAGNDEGYHAEFDAVRLSMTEDEVQKAEELYEQRKQEIRLRQEHAKGESMGFDLAPFQAP